MSETLAKPEETQTPTTTDSTVTSETPETNESRPEWLPEKFKSPEELAKAYGELETWRMKTKDRLEKKLKNLQKMIELDTLEKVLK